MRSRMKNTTSRATKDTTLPLLIALALSAFLCQGCAQRAQLDPEYGAAYRQVFFRQASAQPVQLAPTTAEDAKRISQSRARRSSSTSGKPGIRLGGSGGGSGQSIALKGSSILSQ